MVHANIPSLTRMGSSSFSNYFGEVSFDAVRRWSSSDAVRSNVLDCTVRGIYQQVWQTLEYNVVAHKCFNVQKGVNNQAHRKVSRREIVPGICHSHCLGIFIFKNR